MWIPGSRRAAESLAEFSDTACFVPCKHCSELLQEDDRFCRYCGCDQFDSARFNAAPVVGPAPEPPAVCEAESPPVDVDFADTLQPEMPTAMVLHRATMLAANEEANPDCVIDLRANAFGRRMLEGSAPVRTTGRSMVAFRLAIGALALAVLLALALGRNVELDRLWASGDQQAPADGPPRAAPVPTGVALGISSSGEALNRPTSSRQQDEKPVQAGTRDPIRDIATEVFSALGLAEPATPPAPAEVPQQATVVADPIPASGAANAKQDGCNEALVALAMCPKP